MALRADTVNAAGLGRWIWAVHRHVKNYAATPEISLFEATQEAAKRAELLARLRGARSVGGSVSGPKVAALALAAGIGKVHLEPALKQLGDHQLVQYRLNSSNELVELDEFCPPEERLPDLTHQFFEELRPSWQERAVLASVNLCSQLPLSSSELTDALVAERVPEAGLPQILGLLQAFSLLGSRTVEGTKYLFNEYLWAEHVERLIPMLGRMSGPEKAAMMRLQEALQQGQGRPVIAMEGIAPATVHAAARMGIIDPTTVQTSEGKRQDFYFSPHLYGYQTRAERIHDVANHVKLYVAQMEYARRFARYKLDSPVVFSQRLLDNKVAGNASPIGTDYPLLEKHGIIKVEPTSGARYRMALQKPDVVERALKVMESNVLPGVGGDPRSLLSGPTQFTDPESRRIQLAETVQPVKQLEEDMIGDIRAYVQGFRLLDDPLK